MKLLYLLSALLCLNTAVAQQVKTLNKGKVVQKQYNISVPYQDMNGLIIVQAAIKGKTYNFMVNTGAMGAISETLCKELGLKPEANLNVVDANNQQQGMTLVTLPPVELGGITFKDTPVVVELAKH